MNEYEKICVKEIIKTIIDNEWHDLYSFHKNYRIPIKNIFDSVGELLDAGLIIKVGLKIKLKNELSNQDFRKLNFYFKTTKPELLNFIEEKN